MRALPTPGEAALWDNTVNAQVEVMPNTVGVLHLLGSPSWDGRFLRRYLKSEPKYDLISFFILRDPWDSQQVNEREHRSGPGGIHLLNGLYDAKLDHVPVVAIVGQTARSAVGGAYQQEVDLKSLFKDVASDYLVEVNVAAQRARPCDPHRHGTSGTDGDHHSVRRAGRALRSARPRVQARALLAS